MVPTDTTYIYKHCPYSSIPSLLELPLINFFNSPLFWATYSPITFTWKMSAFKIYDLFDSFLPVPMVTCYLTFLVKLLIHLSVHTGFLKGGKK